MRQRSSGGSSIRLLIGIAIALFSIISYFASAEINEVTGERQYISITPDQEIALGLQAVPEMVSEFGGLYPDEELQRQFDAIGARLVNTDIVQGTPWEFSFSVLNQPDTINAFALPGGPVFITTGLLSQLDTEDEVAGVVAHEIVHILARHSAQRIAQSQLTNGLIGAVAVASESASAAQTAAMVGQLINMQYGREDELESDTLGVCLMLEAGYDPQGMLEVMRVLQEASGGQRQPEFFSTHPNPANRLEAIEAAIQNAPQNCP